jgi:dienelactone hydrolase
MKTVCRVLALLLLGMSAATSRAETVRFPSVAVDNVAAGPEITGALYRPTGTEVGEGPFPAIVLAHTCAGVRPHTEIWGKRLAGWGYVVLAPDSFGPRDVSTVCGNGMVVSGGARVADIAGAMDFLNAQPFVRKNTIGLIGHSHGGWTTMRAVQKRFGLAARGLRGAVAYYPACQAQFDTDVAVPLLILVGDKDDWTPADNCRRLQAAGFTRPELVETIYYPDAYHSFDSQLAPRTAYGHSLRYDPVAAPDAEARTKAFFAKLLKQ